MEFIKKDGETVVYLLNTDKRGPDQLERLRKQRDQAMADLVFHVSPEELKDLGIHDSGNESVTQQEFESIVKAYKAPKKAKTISETQMHAVVQARIVRDDNTEEYSS